MANYMDLLIVDSMKIGHPIIVQAPWMSHIEVGNTVEYSFNDDCGGHGKVVSKMDIRKDDEEIKEFLKWLTIMDADGNLPKATKYFKEVEVEYDE